VKIRQARPEDAAGIQTVHAQSVGGMGSEEYPDDVLTEWGTPRAAEDYAESIAVNPFLVADIDGDVVGFAELDLARCVVRSVYVAPTHARQGIPSRLMRGLDDAARGAGLTEVFLDSSLNAVPFYEAVGFEVIERRKYRLSSGREMDSIRMRKELDH